MSPLAAIFAKSASVHLLNDDIIAAGILFGARGLDDGADGLGDSALLSYDFADNFFLAGDGDVDLAAFFNQGDAVLAFAAYQLIDDKLTSSSIFHLK